jgi:predicted TIM-barrel fold metal-dependent hydrolase
MIETTGSDALEQQAVQRLSHIALIDAHAHVFERGLPLARQRRYAPDYDAPLDVYLEQLDAHNVSRGVLVQPSFLGTDCDYLLAALRRAPDRLRGVAVVEPDCGLEALTTMARAGVVGIRLNLIGLPDLPIETSLTPETLAHIRQLGWHVEVHAEAARLEHIVLPLLDKGLNVVVDHFGRPDPALGVDDEGFRRLLDLASTGQVWVKISAAYRNWSFAEGGRSTPRFAHDAVRLLTEAFGVNRLMWGSDWPHTQFEASQDFGRTLDALLNLLPNEAERRAVSCGTSVKFYRFDEPTV